MMNIGRCLLRNMNIFIAHHITYCIAKCNILHLCYDQLYFPLHMHTSTNFVFLIIHYYCYFLSGRDKIAWMFVMPFCNSRSHHLNPKTRLAICVKRLLFEIVIYRKHSFCVIDTDYTTYKLASRGRRHYSERIQCRHRPLIKLHYYA